MGRQIRHQFGPTPLYNAIRRLQGSSTVDGCMCRQCRPPVTGVISLCSDDKNRTLKGRRDGARSKSVSGSKSAATPGDKQTDRILDWRTNQTDYYREMRSIRQRCAGHARDPVGVRRLHVSCGPNDGPLHEAGHWASLGLPPKHISTSHPYYTFIPACQSAPKAKTCSLLALREKPLAPPESRAGTIRASPRISHQSCNVLTHVYRSQ